MTKNVKKNIKIKSKENSFRINSKKIFLTYSRCNLDLNTTLIQLNNKFPNNKIKEYLFSIEKHEIQEEKGTHIHAFIQLDRKVDITNQLFFDLLNKETKEIFHPNIQGVKCKSECLNYILKDVFNIQANTVLISPTLQTYINTSGKLLEYQEIMINLARKGQINEAMNILEENDKDKFMKSHDSIEKSLRSLCLKANGAIAKFNFNNFYLPDNLKQIINESYNSQKTILMIGDSGTGKTQFMHSFITYLNKNPLIINNIDALRGFKIGIHTAILFDDVDFSDLKHNREMLIHILDCENSSTFNIKHGSIAIPQNIPRFIISNRSLEFYIGDLIKLIEIQRRLTTIDIGTKKLYRIEIN